MKIITGTPELCSAVSTVTSALTTKGVQPILEGILIETQTGGLVKLTASGAGIIMQTSLLAGVREPGKALIPGKLLADLTRKLPGDETTIAANGKSVTVTSNSAKVRLAALDAEAYPAPPQIKQENLKTLTVSSQDLLDALKGVRHAASTDENRLTLTGIKFVCDGSSLQVIALDGFRLAMRRINCESNNAEFEMLVPGEAMRTLEKIMAGDKTAFNISTDGSIAVFSDGSLVSMQTVLLSGSYPDVSRIVPASFDSEAKTNSSDLRASVERAKLLAPTKGTVRLDLHGDGILVTGYSEAGNLEDDLAADTIGLPLSISFNPKYLLEALDSFSGKDVIVRFNSPTSPAVIVPADNPNGGSIALLLPVKTFEGGGGA